MVYELRPWFEDDDCLYTDDPRLKDMAVQSPGLHVTASYFRTPADRVPFAWDIVGEHGVLAEIAGRFQRRHKPRPGRQSL